MAKPPSPLVGYNNNVRHKNRVFHIQTEDSGITRPHIITHLFMDGGRILKSVKSSYAEHVGADGMAETVRQMMKDQHKAMFIALRDGQFDHLVDAGNTGGRPALPSTPALEIEGARSSSPSLVDRPSLADREALRGGSHSLVDPPSLGGREALRATLPDTTSAPFVAAVAALPADPPRRLTPPPPAMHLAANAANPVHVEGTRQLADLTDAPDLDATVVRGPDGLPAIAGGIGSAPLPGDGRYAPARPAAIFGPARPQQGKSIFGEDPIGDKSLDEVILSYLAEDLEGERK